MESGQLLKIDEIGRIIAPVAEQYGVRKISVFGSYARGDATEESDMDFHIIDCGSLHGLIRLAGFELALEEILNISVDVVTTDSLYEDIRQTIELEEKIVYDAS